MEIYCPIVMESRNSRSKCSLVSPEGCKGESVQFLFPSAWWFAGDLERSSTKLELLDALPHLYFHVQVASPRVHVFPLYVSNFPLF